MSDVLVKRLRRRWPNEDPKTQAEKKEAADLIEELEAQLREAKMQSLSAFGQADEAYKEKLAAEAKLEKAVEALEKLARLGNGDRYGNSDGNMIARATLEELKNTPPADS